MVRLGIGIYGYCSDASVFNQLRPAITWKSVISQLKSIKVGESVGYGRNFIAQRETTIAIIAIGYADGFRRSLSKGIGSIAIQGVMCPVIGNVCMDMTMVDVTGISVKEGDSVEIIGDYQPLAVLAKKMNTIPYEVLTNIAPRVHRIYLEE
jgi:alanine racemase